MDQQRLKAKASEAFAKGRFSKAAELYTQYCSADPNDHLAALRMGDAFAKAGERNKAIDAYQSVAEGFAKAGFLPRAIAAAKLILELDPSHQSVQQMLAELYAQRDAHSPRRLSPAEGNPPVPFAPSAVEDRLDVDIEEEEPVHSESRFTELNLEEESLLQAVEAAAMRRSPTPPLPRASRREGVPSPRAGPVLSLSKAEGQGAAAPLPKIPLFSDLSADAFVALFERCALRRFANQARVINEGEAGNSFFVICAGSVRVFRQAEKNQKTIATLTEGAFFGEMALLSRSPRAASVESASEETQLLEISAPVLIELSARYPTVAKALTNFYRRRLLANIMDISPLFQPFGRADRDALIEHFQGQDVPPGRQIIREGEDAQALYVVLSGEVEVRRSNQMLLAKLKEGDVFGEMSLLTKNPATASVISTRLTTLLCLPKKDFDVLILSHPQVLAAVSELTDEREKKTQNLLAAKTAVLF